MKTERKDSPWFMLRENVLRLADNLKKHRQYLNNQTEAVTEAHERKL